MAFDWSEQYDMDGLKCRALENTPRASCLHVNVNSHTIVATSGADRVPYAI